MNRLAVLLLLTLVVSSSFGQVSEQQGDALDPKLDTDLVILTLLGRLNHEEEKDVKVRWVKGFNAVARGHDKIEFGRELAQLIDHLPYPQDRRQLIYAFVLGHEYTHLLQDSELESGRAKELVADVGGGAWTAIELGPESRTLADGFINSDFAFWLGSERSFDSDYHGNADERSSAFMLGYMALTADQRGGLTNGTPATENVPHHRLSRLVVGRSAMYLQGIAMSAERNGWQHIVADSVRTLRQGAVEMPKTLSGLVPVRTGRAAFSYAMKYRKSPLLPGETFELFWDRISDEVRAACRNWDPLDVEEGSDKAVEEEKRRARSAVSPISVQIGESSDVLQETAEGGVRVSMFQLKGRMPDDQWVVVTFSSDRPLTGDQRRQFEADLERSRKLAKRIDQDTMAEPRSVAQSREDFYSALKQALTGGHDPRDVPLPAGIRRVDTVGPAGARGACSYILFDTENREEGERLKTQFGAHTIHAFVRDGVWEPVMNFNISLSGLNNPDVAAALRALDGFGDHPACWSETHKVTGTGSYPRVVLVHFELPGPRAQSNWDRLALVMYVVW